MKQGISYIDLYKIRCATEPSSNFKFSETFMAHHQIITVKWLAQDLWSFLTFKPFKFHLTSLTVILEFLVGLG